MIIIKATLRDETRRLQFDAHGFPAYDEIQRRLRSAFSLPSSAHAFWTNVLFFPDDTQSARIKFKQHICDQAEYERAQQPFLRYGGFPAPALVFTILLSSDIRMNEIHDFHRAVHGRNEANNMEEEIYRLETELTIRHQILISLEDNLQAARAINDSTAADYWADKVAQKRLGLPELEEKLRGVRCRHRLLSEELDRLAATSTSTSTSTSPGLSLREWSDHQETDDMNRMAETENELAAWLVGHAFRHPNLPDPNLSGPDLFFPPLDQVMGGAAPHRRRPWHAPSNWGNNLTAWALPDPPQGPAQPANSTTGYGLLSSFGDLFASEGPSPSSGRQRSILDLFDTPELTAAPAREVGMMLDRFLNHFQGQLADTLDGFAQRIAPHPSEELPIRPAANTPEVHVPGAFVQPESAQSSDAQVQTAMAEKAEQLKPSVKHGKGGYRHKHITCDGCLTGIRGTRYKCEQCSDYDLCGSCLPFLHTDALHSSSHTFKAMVHPGLEERIKFGGTTSSRAPHQSSRHPATCDICNELIVGVRWKCLNCPDWDCCSACSKLIPSVHPDHSFVKLHKPTDYVMNAAWDAKNDVHHPYVVCDGCNMTIRGPRFKCMHPDCPDYDLCVKCEAAPVPIHPESHPMLKTKMPLRINSKSSFDPIKNPTPQATSGFGGSVDVRSSAFARGEDYAKAVDAILKSMSSISIAGTSCPQDLMGVNEGDSATLTSAQPINPQPAPASSISKEPIGSPAAGKEEPLVDDDAPNVQVTSTAPSAAPEVAQSIPAQAADPAVADVAAAEPATAAVATEPVTETEPADPLDILTWVRHVTINPSTTLPPGTEFTKTWQLRNFASGEDYDFNLLYLVHKSEGVLGDACKMELILRREDIIKNADIQVTIPGLKVPHLPGRQILEQWRFEDENGREYGQPLRIRIEVEERQSSGESTASSSFIVPRAPLEHTEDSFYLPTPVDRRPVPTSEELSERLSSVPSSTAGHDDDASSTFSFSDVEHVTHDSVGRNTSTDDFTADDYDFVDETDEETEDGF
ncbi:hypothetical protein CC85DRAFT_280109 [Cutaneotrichosporon oleaginosum]|uniref:ZZ-type domain-containing protein n=1 Tax=Cutaneotrichosporon oleaginosum TaxID=879819 RepID=A0A0J0XDA5_9TREE|nr:uncharacterized protein CC85DRAFT_280109 [Cutaneotrichosporon oleaginosum]KLT39018.1 hypothetical protein CC85DRAFT_280109 [Cutaneotrichosporon oleaginosum]TXT03971.1 hypothetical protein COLE_07668 [Cutaneotrichosporon oleaginosum]